MSEKLNEFNAGPDMKIHWYCSHLICEILLLLKTEQYKYKENLLGEPNFHKIQSSGLSQNFHNTPNLPKHYQIY
jgi:hypothetical protein